MVLPLYIKERDGNWRHFRQPDIPRMINSRLFNLFKSPYSNVYEHVIFTCHLLTLNWKFLVMVVAFFVLKPLNGTVVVPVITIGL